MINWQSNSSPEPQRPIIFRCLTGAHPKYTYHIGEYISYDRDDSGFEFCYWDENACDKITGINSWAYLEEEELK